MEIGWEDRCSNEKGAGLNQAPPQQVQCTHRTGQSVRDGLTRATHPAPAPRHVGAALSTSGRVY